ncbi:MAG: hypothetical protein RLZZ387_5768 [Chloroflexota bacterium]
MNDISTAREQLLQHEQARPGPGQSSVVWEDGHWWSIAFHQLAASERTADAASAAWADRLAPGSDAALALCVERDSSAVQSLAWYNALLARLRAAEQRWGTDPQGRPLAPPSLYSHLALIDEQIAACGARRAVNTLEYLEHQRRAHGRLPAGRWPEAWSNLNAALRTQSATHRHWRGHDPPERAHAERLAALERVARIQAETRAAWNGASHVDLHGLEDNMRTLARFIDSLRPGRRAPLNFPVLALGALVVVLLLMLVRPGEPAQSDAQPGATPPSQARDTLRGDAATEPTEGPRGDADLAVAAPQVPPDAPDSIPPEARAWRDDGLARLRQGRYEEAVRAFEEALILAPSWHALYSDKALCLYELGQREPAIRAWLLALDLAPAHADAAAALGVALHAAGEQAEGQRWFAQALAAEPRYRDADWLREERLWGANLLADSAFLRGEPAPAPTSLSAPKPSP